MKSKYGETVQTIVGILPFVIKIVNTNDKERDKRPTVTIVDELSFLTSASDVPRDGAQSSAVLFHSVDRFVRSRSHVRQMLFDFRRQLLDLSTFFVFPHNIVQ